MAHWIDSWLSWQTLQVSTSNRAKTQKSSGLRSGSNGDNMSFVMMFVIFDFWMFWVFSAVCAGALSCWNTYVPSGYARCNCSRNLSYNISIWLNWVVFPMTSVKVGGHFDRRFQRPQTHDFRESLALLVVFCPKIYISYLFVQQLS